MIYDTSNEFQAQEAKTRLEYLISRKKVVDLTAVSPHRTIKQNSYLHLLIGYFASLIGERSEYVKREYYKIQANKEIFVCDKYDKLLERNVKYLKSSADLTTEEMSTTIERFKNWSAENGYLLPDAEDEKGVITMQREIERCKQWI